MLVIWKTKRIEAQVERFAPGFRQLILARHTMNTADMERHNPNYVGGDIDSGIVDITQLLTRPVPSLTPYTIPSPGLFLLLLVNSAGWRSSWDVWILCRPRNDELSASKQKKMTLWS